MAKRFEPVAFDETKKLSSSLIVAAAKKLEAVFNSSLKPSRETSLAFTKLEEAVMWANRAIAVEDV